MPETVRRTDAPPDGWPETLPRYEAKHAGVVAWVHLALLFMVASAAIWAALEVRALRGVMADT